MIWFATCSSREELGDWSIPNAALVLITLILGIKKRGEMPTGTSEYAVRSLSKKLLCVRSSVSLR